MAKVKVTWVRSLINRVEKHRRTLRALGFTHLNQVKIHGMTPQIKGMLDQVGYLCKIEKIDE